MTIHQALKKYPKIEIELLLQHVLKKPKEFIFLHPEKKLSRYQIKKVSSLIKRRQKGEPVAYILGYKDFYGLRFRVNKNVLIPRPETEWLVERVAQATGLPHNGDKQASGLHYKDSDTVKILDLGTGSGCIAIAIAAQLQEFQISNFKYQITATDISKKALSVAKFNAKKILHYDASMYHSKIIFHQSNLFNKINGRFDIIVANLPYVPEADLGLRIKDNPELGFEPLSALTDGTNKFYLYHKLFLQLPSILNPKSVIYLEVDPKAKKYILVWTKKYLPGAKVTFYRDYNKLWRYAIILF